MQIAQTPPAPVKAAMQAAPSSSGSSWHLWANGSFSFHDLLDAINPLQHLPIVSTIYREVTGDNIGNAARVAGDALYGGVIGLAAGLINAVSVSDTGKDLGERVIAMIEGDDKPSAKTGTVTVEPLPVQTAPASVPQAAARAKQPESGNAIPAEAALAALPSRPPVDLPYFPGGGPPSAASAAPVANPPIVQTAAVPSIPISDKPRAIPVSPGSHGFAIDTSDEGILAMRAKGHGPAPVPLQLSAGSLPATIYNANAVAPGAKSAAQGAATAAASPNANDFVMRMRQGIDKYNALLAQRAASGQGKGRADQVNGTARTFSGMGAIGFAPNSLQ